MKWYNPLKIVFLLIVPVMVAIPGSMAQRLPDGHILQYHQDFNSPRSLSDFRVETPESWGIFKNGGNYYLHFSGSPGSKDPSGRPGNIAVLNDRVFGDFILEADVMPHADTNGFSEICLFVGLKDYSNYYCIQLANKSDSLTHGIYVVKKSVIKKLTAPDAPPVAWKADKWQHIRLERNIVKRTIIVYAGDMQQPLLQIKDYELVMGSVGFGSFAGAGQIDNIRIWAPTVISEE